MKQNSNLLAVQRLLLVFMVALFLSGVTAIPVDAELKMVLPLFSEGSHMNIWLQKVLDAYSRVKHNSQFLLYGYDWLAFAHFVLALLFYGPYRDPVKNIWVIKFGMIACVLIVPFAFIAGYFRGIPVGWQWIDCSFGFFGFLMLWICYRKTKRFERLQHFNRQRLSRVLQLVHPGQPAFSVTNK